MFPLIEIKTVPIEIEMKITDASLEYKRGTAEMEISHSGNGQFDIKSRPIKLNVDTFEASNSLRPTTARSIVQAAQKGQQAAYQATATYAQHGSLMLNAKLGQSNEIARQIAQEPVDKQINRQSGLSFIPNPGADISWDKGSFQIRYEMDKMNINWKIDHGGFQFTPGDIEINVKQQPDVIIRYMGGPIYVPPSADPNYEPIDVKA